MNKIGVISAVYVETDEKRVYVDVIVGVGRQYEGVEFAMPLKGMWMVPSVGDKVEVYEVSGRQNGRVRARYPHNPPDHDMPAGLGEGDLVISLNAGTSLHFSKNPSGTYDLDIGADGNITIDGIDIDAHTHDYEDDNGTSTTTKTTEAPN